VVVGARAFLEITCDGVRLLVRATPGAAKDDITGIWNGADGETRLAVKVTAAPDKGKANTAIIKLLAKRLGLPKSSMSIISGETSRLKTVAISGDYKRLAAALNLLTGEI
jgi:uncharacterized protein